MKNYWIKFQKKWKKMKSKITSHQITWLENLIKWRRTTKKIMPNSPGNRWIQIIPGWAWMIASTRSLEISLKIQSYTWIMWSTKRKKKSEISRPSTWEKLVANHNWRKLSENWSTTSGIVLFKYKDKGQEEKKQKINFPNSNAKKFYSSCFQMKRF